MAELTDMYYLTDQEAGSPEVGLAGLVPLRAVREGSAPVCLLNLWVAIYIFRWCSPCIFTSPALGAYLCCQIASFWKDTIHPGKGSTPVTSFQLCKDPVSNYSHSLRS